jgi:tetratricopeptide (TPR) repeat protein
MMDGQSPVFAPRPLDPHLAEQFAAAVARYTAGAPLEAAELLSAILREAPDHADTLRLRGLSLVRSGRPAAALDDLRRARNLAPTEPLSHLHYGIAMQDLGRHARAAALFRRAAILAPEAPATWTNFASALLALGRNQAARAAARRAVAHAAADDAGAVYTLGLTQLALGDAGAASGAFAEAVRRQPQFADAWINLVLSLMRSGRMPYAVKAVEKGLAACPANSALEATSASLAVLAGDQEHAIDRLRRIITRDPACTAARLNLANAMLLDGDVRDALEILGEVAPTGRRDAAHWRAHRALALLQLGRDAQAQAELDAIAPPYGDAELLILWRRIHLAARAGQETEAMALAERMSALADDETASVFEHRVIAHFDLARFRARRAENEVAFGHWVAGHRLMARVQPFSRPRFAAFFEASVQSYDAARLIAGPVADNSDPSPVFIVGLPRSGTSLMEQVLAAHPQVHGAGERPAVFASFSRLSTRLSAGAAYWAEGVRRVAAAPAATLTAVADRHLTELHAIAPAARYITDKMPGNALYLGFIATLFPQARIIFCRRDLRDTGLSIFQHRFFGYHPYAHDLSDLGWYMAAHERLMEHWRSVLPLARLTVDLGDWVFHFDHTLERVLTFLDLPPDPACERFHEQDRRVRTASAAQVRQPINDRGMGKWRAFEPQLAPLMAELAGLV